MRKLRLIMLGLFCAGLLLTGIGVGVSFMEFSALSYTGLHVPEQAQRYLQSFSVELPEGEAPVYITSFFPQDGSSAPMSFYTSDSVAAGSAEVALTYQTVGPTAYVWTERADTSGVNRLCLGTQSVDSTAILMAFRDAALRDLRAGRIGSYLAAQLTHASITLNPADSGRVLPAEKSSVTEILA